MEGLLDFGTGGLSGAGAGASIASGLKLSSPWSVGLTAGLGVTSGLISLFGGSSQRKLEKRANKQAMALGDLQLSQARRVDRQQRDADNRKRQFGQLLGDYFRSKAGQ